MIFCRSQAPFESNIHSILLTFTAGLILHKKVFVSCILVFLLHDVTQREVDDNKWPDASFIIDFAN